MEQVSGQPPSIIFESTGHYHEPVLQFLEDHGITYYLINPVVSFEARKTSLHKVKQTKSTRFIWAILQRRPWEVYQRKTDQVLNLRLLAGQDSALTDSYVEIKLQFQAAPDQIFPEYHGVFSDLCGKLSLKTLLHYPTSSDIHKVSQKILANEMRQFGAGRFQTWFLDKATQF